MEGWGKIRKTQMYLKQSFIGEGSKFVSSISIYLVGYFSVLERTFAVWAIS